MKYSNIWQAKRYRTVYYYINKFNPQKILEIWSWSQWIWNCYDIKFDWLDLTTADYWLEEKETNKNMNFINGSAFDMPIEDNSYDFVYSTDMIEHINKYDREKVFEEAIRVCKKWWYVFPCWIWWKLSDIIIYIIIKFFCIIKKNNKIPGWLIEHLNIDYPKSKEINEIIENYNVIENKLVHNIFVWTVLSLVDFSRLKKEWIASKILNDMHLELESLLGVRKLILIKK